MTEFEPRFESYAEKVRGSFVRQRIMALLGAELSVVEPGRVEIVLPFREDLTQQHGFVHAGVLSTIADSAGGYAALTLMEESSSILGVEFKMNFLRPAAGERMVATGRVVKPGSRLSFTELEVHAWSGDEKKLVATGQQTAIQLPGDPSTLPSG